MCDIKQGEWKHQNSMPNEILFLSIVRHSQTHTLGKV